MKQVSTTAIRYPYSLTTELWNYIFSLTTRIPYELGAADWEGDYDKLEMGRQTLDVAENDEFLAEKGSLFRRQLVFRRSLFLVCKSWRRIAAKYLYRSIIILRPSIIHSIVYLLSNREHVARNVMRLLIDLRQLEADDRLTRSIVEIVTLCPRLTHLNITLPDDTMNTLDLLTAAHNQPIRQFHLHPSPIPLLSAPSLDIISSFQHLRSLELPTDVCDDSLLIPNLQLPALEALDLGFQGKITQLAGHCLSTWSLPSLHTVHVILASAASLELEKFWDVHRERIVTLKLSVSYSSDAKGDILASAFGISRDLNESLPCIRQVIFNKGVPQGLIDDWIPTSTLETLEVEFGAICPGYRGIFGDPVLPTHFIENLSRKGSRLRTVRISRWPKLLSNKWQEDAEKLIEQANLEKNGIKLIRIDDARCDLIQMFAGLVS